MTKRVVEHTFTGDTVAYTAYDSTKTMLGKLIQQKTGAANTDKFAGPMPIGIARPMEAGTNIPGMFPHAIKFSDDLYWVFLADNATATTTRRLVMYTYTPSTSTFNWQGFITLTFPGGNITIRGFRMSRELYTTGTAAVSGTAVTGTGTAWTDSGLAAGSRIGFGSTDPTQITTWYEVSAIGSNTGITLTASGGTIADGPYVICDLRALISVTSVTTTNGGVFLVKGLRPETFAPGGTSISTATTVDNIRAMYWLADAATVTNTIACGLAIDDKVSWTEQYIYVIDGTGATCRVYKYNVRASLTSLSSGKSTAAYVLVTGQQNPGTTVTQLNNGRIGTLAHGPASGVKSLYFVTLSRVFRADLSLITSGNTTWQSDSMAEIPPGGPSTYAATGALSSVEITNTIDRLVVITSGASAGRSYVTKYTTSSEAWDHIFLIDDRQMDQTSADSDSVVHPSINALPFSVWVEDGICFLARHSAAATYNQLYSLPMAAHWTYAAGTPNQQLITPSLSIPNASRFHRVYVGAEQMLGSGTLGMQTEPFRLYYRLSGIADNTGEWTLVDDADDLSNILPSSAIQFMFEFRILGTACIPARIYSVALVYEDNTTDSHYQPSVVHSSVANKQFAWRFSTAFGGTVPTLRIRLYDAVSGNLLVDDVSDTPTGTWEKSTNDGGAWSSYNTTDKGNETTYIRYTPASLGDDVKVRALLTQE